MQENVYYIKLVHPNVQSQWGKKMEDLEDHNGDYISNIQGDQLYMAVCFLVKKWLFQCVWVDSCVHWTSHFLQGTRKGRPCFAGQWWGCKLGQLAKIWVLSFPACDYTRFIFRSGSSSIIHFCDTIAVCIVVTSPSYWIPNETAGR